MKLLSWSRRHAALQGGHSLSALREAGEGEVALQSGLPPAWVHGVRTFYDELHAPAGPLSCAGTACTFAGRADRDGPVARCLGRCYEAPAQSDAPSGPIPRSSLVDEPIVLRGLLSGQSAPGAEEYALPDGPTILERVAQSGLRGRGGAAYPTGAKWRVAAETPAPDRFVVVNGDEGDPGSYVDRLLLEESPHAVLAGVLACARAIGARRAVVFIRGEYPAAYAATSAAVAEAAAGGWLGDLTVRVLRGAGSYVAGEETALLRAIQGLRAEPWPKPPYPAQSGLDGLPTVVQNVETLAMIPWLVRQGRRGDTKAVCLSGAVRRPGVVEIPLGMPLLEVLERAGGGAPLGRRWKMALVGGPMGRVLSADQLDTPLSYDGLPGMGHGGVVMLDSSVGARDLAAHLYEFASAESCGNCTPCRVGTTQLSSRPDRASLERLLNTLETGSLCGFGQGVPRPIRDLLTLFPVEMFPC